jgi:uncharacterized protein CbrC (UPF0167 family)
MQEPLPVFWYQPNAAEDGAFIRRRGICDLCGKEREYFCASRFYVYGGPELRRIEVCPWCLADGTAEENAERDYPLLCDFDGDVDEREKSVILLRTPGFLAAQETVWLTHCGAPCAYLGTVDKEYLTSNGIDVREDLEREARRRRHTADDVLFMLEHNNIYMGHLFRCLKCGAYRLSVDCD